MIKNDIEKQIREILYSENIRFYPGTVEEITYFILNLIQEERTPMSCNHVKGNLCSDKDGTNFCLACELEVKIIKAICDFLKEEMEISGNYWAGRIEKKFGKRQ